MKYLFHEWQQFVAEISGSDGVLLLSDFDGTLTPIVGSPKDVMLSPNIRESLQVLAARKGFNIGVVSGRQLAELKDLVGINGIFYAGNHGLEIEGPGISYVNEAARKAGAEMKELTERFRQALADIPGVIIENKGLSLSVHYRLAEETRQSEVIRQFQETTAPAIESGTIRTTAGKKVLEVRPPVDWDKGQAMLTIKRELENLSGIQDSLVIYLGDDVTDEDVFRILRRPRGWSVHIGGENDGSAAQYYLKSVDEVAEMLSRLTVVD